MGQAGPVIAGDRAWDQGRAKRMVSKVLEVEGNKSRPWNRIPWRTSAVNAAKEARQTGKPVFIFFYLEGSAPSVESSCLEGRLLRTHVLSDPAVLAFIKARCVPVKVKLAKDKEFPLDWPALDRWVTTFKFRAGKGLAGCSVVSADLEIEYGNSGSANLWELFESRAYNSGSFAAMLEQAALRITEERSLRVQRGISDFERKMELRTFRRGVRKAVRSQHDSRLPPRGYSLERAMELQQMAGAVEKPAG
ncbi:MAG: hypothetical protein GWO24_05640 [Akkermansiaceae bacterium]|nr:hypothetical protein [Akkermansiaceae bacterium]